MEFLNRPVEEIIVHMLDTISTEWISRDMMVYVEQALAGTQFPSGAMVLQEVIHHLKLVALVANEVFSYGNLLCCFFLERVPSL